ncbi:MAG: HEPN domain-containing protein [Verrucomicrobia bacterium]|nr:HEPN domain-containing protein [Verrucomicrobiota bacterium]
MKDATPKLLDKAASAIHAAETLLAEQEADFAAGRAYYALFYVAEALLNEEGLHFHKHGAVHAAFGERFAKTGRLDPKFHRWLLDAFDKRIEGDYGVETKITAADVTTMIAQAREFLQTVRQHLT